jgi:hypothetical protein
MSIELSISEPIDLEGEDLPYNFIPAAFPSWASLPGAQGRVVFALPTDLDTGRSSAQYHIASAETLSDPRKMIEFLQGREDDQPKKYAPEGGLSAGTGAGRFDASAQIFLGPPSKLEQNAPSRPLTLAFADLPLVDGAPYDQAAVIIDIGISYWNSRFRNAGGGSRFKAMRYLDFDATGPAASSFDGLNEAEIDADCKLSDTPGGQRAVVAKLGKRFPASYFGPDGGAPYERLWHGTAMADLMAGLPEGTPDKTALFGIDLPMAVLKDSDGDSLSLVLPLMLEAALAITQGFGKKPIFIVLPWGFSAGPQDGSHPTALAIDRVLAAHADRKVKLLVPMGNQLQDMCCAHLLPVKPHSTDPAEDIVDWQIPPDDFSQNAVEICVTKMGAAAIQNVRIDPPVGGAFVVALNESQAVVIFRNGSIIGVLLRYPDSTSGPRLRLVLAPTGLGGAGVNSTTPFGTWTLSFASTDEVRLWVLRDDRDLERDGSLPRRPSAFFDLAYKETDALGTFGLADDPGSAVVRSGTASLLATAKKVVAVQANELPVGLPQRQAFYSGRSVSGVTVSTTAVVDRDDQGSGILAFANGGEERTRVSGTSAAVSIYARSQLGLPPYA